MSTLPRYMRHAAGLSLVELMIALAIGSVLIVGTVYMYSQSRTTYQVNENVARLQEQARYVLSVLEPDIELAGYYGFTNSAEALRLVRDGNPDALVAVASQMRQRSPVPPAPVAVSGLPGEVHACGTNFALDVLMPVQGSNGTFALGPNHTAACAPGGGGALPGTDTLTIRRASAQTVAARAGRLQIHASRLRSRTGHLMFVDGAVPGPLDDDHRLHDLVVRTYYVSRDSVGRPGLPALRVKWLTERNGSVYFEDEEVMPGVEDLQVQFGIDTGDYDNDGVIDPEADVDLDGVPEASGRATRYVNPDFPGLERYQVVAVRVWVRVRADQREPGFVDDREYRYADVPPFRPAGDERHFRRLVMARTVTLRNARTL